MNQLMKWAMGAAVLFCALFAGLTQLVLPEALKQAVPYVETLAADYVNGAVAVGEVTWPGGNVLAVKQLRITDKNGKQVAELPEARISLNPFQALTDRDKAISVIELKQPVVYITEDGKGNWNFTGLMKPSTSDTTPFYGTIRIEGGRVVVQMPEGIWECGIDGTISGASNPYFDLDFSVRAPGLEAAKMTGSVTTTGKGKIRVRSEGMDLEPYAPLALRYGQVKEAGGRAEKIDVRWQDSGEETLLEGSVDLQAVRGKVELQEEVLQVQASGTVSAADHAVTVSGLRASVNGQTAVISGTADISDRNNLKGQMEITADTFTWNGETLRNIRAEAVLADQKAALNFLEAEYGGGRLKGSGTYELETGRVTGQADIRQVTFEAGAGNEAVSVNAVLAGDGVYDRKTGKLKANIAANTMDLKWRETVLRVLDLDADVTEEGMELRNFSAFTDTGALQAAGKMTYGGVYDLRGRMSDMPLRPVLTAMEEEGSGFLSASYHVYGEGRSLNFEGETRVRQLRYNDLSAADGHGTVSVRDGVAQIKDYFLTMEQGSHVVNGTIDLRGAEPAADLTVHTERVRVEPLLAFSGLSDKVKVTGNLTNDLTLRGTFSHPHVTGKAVLSDGSVNGYLVDSMAGEYAYEDGSLTLRDVAVQALSASLLLNGRMDATRRLDFNASAQNVDLSRLPVRTENVDLKGYASFEGHLRGTVELPLFEGTVTSDSFTLNGVEVAGLEGALRSNGRDTNILRGSFRQPKQGAAEAIYKVDLTLDMPRKDLRGTAGVLYGDVQSLLKMARLDYPIQGVAAGTIQFNGPDADTVLDGWIYDIDINKVKYDQMLLKARLHKGLLTLDTVKLQENRDFSEDGFIALGGQIDLVKRTLNLEAGAVSADPAILTAFMKQPLELKGVLNMAMQLEGSLDDPVGNGSVEITQGSLSGASFDRAIAMLTLKNDHIRLEQLLAEQDIYKLTAAGDVPLDLFRRDGQRRDPRAQMNIDVDFSQASLAVLTALSQVEWGVGDTTGQVKLSGTLEEPLLYGSFGVQDGVLKLRNIDTPIDKINVTAFFRGSRIDLENFSAILEKGTVEGSGTYDLRASEEKAYRLSGRARNAEIHSDLFRGRINGQVTVEPEHYRIPGPSGEEGWRPRITADVRLDDVLVNMPTVPVLSEGNSNLGLDVIVKLGPKIHLYNKYLYDLWLKGGLHILGSTRFPRIDGSIETDKGTITYLRTRFLVDRASLNWIEPGTFLPTVSLASHAKFSRYRVFADLGGPLSQDTLELKLHSNPALPQNTLIRMLTLQRFSAGSDNVTNEDLQNLLIAGLETGLLGDVEQWIKQTLGIDEFRLYMGKLENGVDFDNRIVRELTREEREQYNFLVAKNLTDRWKVGYTRSFNGLYDNTFTQYQLSDHVNLTYSRDESSRNRYSVEYHVTF